MYVIQKAKAAPKSPAKKPVNPLSLIFESETKNSDLKEISKNLDFCIQRACYSKGESCPEVSRQEAGESSLLFLNKKLSIEI